MGKNTKIDDTFMLALFRFDRVLTGSNLVFGGVSFNNSIPGSARSQTIKIEMIQLVLEDKRQQAFPVFSVS